MASSGGKEDKVKEESEDCRPVGCLRILSQREFDQSDYPVYEGESTIGRDESCDLSIDSIALSRTHAVLLVEKGVHFIMDTGSVNKTFRDMLQLRPNAYYELTNGIELTLADIRCRYYTVLPEDLVIREDEPEPEPEPEATQAYALGEGDNDEDATDSEDEEAQTAMTSLPARDESNSACGSDDTGAVSYTTARERVGDVEMESDRVSEEDADSDPASPPLLASTRLLPTTPALRDINREQKEELAKEPPLPVDPPPPIDPYDDETDYEDETQAPDVHKPGEQKKKMVTVMEPEVTSSPSPEACVEENGKAPVGGGVEQTVAYNMETDDEQETEEVGGGKEGGAGVAATVPYAMETDEEGDDDEKERENKVRLVDPTVPYKMEETDDDEEEKSGVIAEEKGGVEPTVAYKIDSDEGVEDTEDNVGGGVEPTVAYNLDEGEEEVDSEDVVLTTPKKKSGPFLDSEQTEEVTIEDSDETDLEGEVPVSKSTEHKETASTTEGPKPSSEAVELAEEIVGESGSTHTLRRHSFSLVPVVSSKRKGRAKGGVNTRRGKERASGRATAAKRGGRKGRISPGGSTTASEADSVESSGIHQTTSTTVSSSSSRNTFRRTRSRAGDVASSSSGNHDDEPMTTEETVAPAESTVTKPDNALKDDFSNKLLSASESKETAPGSVVGSVSGVESREDVPSLPVMASKSDSLKSGGVSTSSSGSSRQSRRTRGKAKTSPDGAGANNGSDDRPDGAVSLETNVSSLGMRAISVDSIQLLGASKDLTKSTSPTRKMRGQAKGVASSSSSLTSGEVSDAITLDSGSNALAVVSEAKGVASVTSGELSDNPLNKGLDSDNDELGTDQGIAEGVASHAGPLTVKVSPGKKSDSSDSAPIKRKTRSRQNLSVASSASMLASESAGGPPPSMGLDSGTNTRKTRGRGKGVTSTSPSEDASDSTASSVALGSSSKLRDTRGKAKSVASVASTAPSEGSSEAPSSVNLGSSSKLRKTQERVRDMVSTAASSMSEDSSCMKLGSSDNPAQNLGGAKDMTSGNDDVSVMSSCLGPGSNINPSKTQGGVEGVASSVPSEDVSMGHGCSNPAKSMGVVKGVASSGSAAAPSEGVNEVSSNLDLGSSTNLRKTRGGVKGVASSAIRLASEVSEAPSGMGLGSSKTSRKTRGKGKGVVSSTCTLESQDGSDVSSAMGLGCSNTPGENQGGAKGVATSASTLESQDVSDASFAMGLGCSNTPGKTWIGAKGVASSANIQAGEEVGKIPPSGMSTNSVGDSISTSTTELLGASNKILGHKAKGSSDVMSDGDHSEDTLAPGPHITGTVPAGRSSSTTNTKELCGSSKLRRTRSTAKTAASTVASSSSKTSTAASVSVEAGPPKPKIPVESSDEQSKQGSSGRHRLKRPAPTDEGVLSKRPKMGEDPLREESPDIETSSSTQSGTASVSTTSVEPGPLMAGPGKVGRARGSSSRVRASKSASMKPSTPHMDTVGGALAGPPASGVSPFTRLDSKGSGKRYGTEEDSMSEGASLVGKVEKSPAKCNLLKASKTPGDEKQPISSQKTPSMAAASSTPTSTSAAKKSTLYGFFKPSSPVSTDDATGAGDIKHSVMFTGVIDKEGEKRLKALGGTLAEDVYECTHLITDKVRRTVKFLCCLSRGCVIVNDNWLKVCHKAGHFLPPEEFSVQDKAMEKQYNFSLARSLEVARKRPLLTGYTVYMTPSIKPTREQMSDIIICSGGEPAHFRYPLPRAPKILVLSCEEDIELCRECIEVGGQSVHVVELVLGGVLRQRLDLTSHLLALPKKDKPAKTTASAKKPATRTPKVPLLTVPTRSPKSTAVSPRPPTRQAAKSPKPSTRSPKSPARSPAPATRKGRSKAAGKVSSSPAKKSLKRPAKEPAQTASKRRRRN